MYAPSPWPACPHALRLCAWQPTLRMTTKGLTFQLVMSPYLKECWIMETKRYSIWKSMNRGFICVQYYGLTRPGYWVIDSWVTYWKQTKYHKITLQKVSLRRFSQQQLRAGSYSSEMMNPRSSSFIQRKPHLKTSSCCREIDQRTKYWMWTGCQPMKFISVNFESDFLATALIFEVQFSLYRSSSLGLSS